MKKRVKSLLEAMIRDLNADRYEDIVALYEFPFDLHLEDDHRLLHTSSEAMEIWRIFRQRFTAGGHRRSEIRIVAMELPEDGRFRVWTEVQHQDRLDRPSGKTNVTFRFHARGTRLSLLGQAVTRKAPANLGDGAIMLVGGR